MAIWYMNNEVFRDLSFGSQSCKELGIDLPDPKNLPGTHTMVLNMSGVDLDDAFTRCNDPVPNGLLAQNVQMLGLRHTSMSVGDIVVMDGHAFMCDNSGWYDLGKFC